MKTNPVIERYCREYGITFEQFVVLARKVEKAASLQEKASGDDNFSKKAEEVCNEVDSYAASIGYTHVRWDEGIYPRFYKGEQNALLPLD